MNISFAAACLLGLAVTVAGSAHAAAPVPAAGTKALIASCHPGRDHERAPTEGSTPTELKGVRIVSAAEAHCLMTKLRKDLTVIAAQGDERKLPNAAAMPWAGTGGSEAATRLKETLVLMGKGKPDDPLLFYCHHASCRYSQFASVHAVSAGYRNVFWFRDGMRGWENDGYAFAGEENKDVEKRLERRMAACSRSVNSTQDMIEIMASHKVAAFNAGYPAAVKVYREEARDCMRLVDAEFGTDKARKADVAREAARIDSALEKQWPNARAALEADPRVYLAPLFDKVPLSDIDAYVNRARSLKSVDATCPPPSYELPRTSAQASSKRAALETYATCMNELKNGSLSQEYSVEALDGVTNLVAFGEPYTCAKNRSQNCLPDATWRKVAAAVGADKLQAIRQGEEKRGEMLKQMLVAQTRLNNYTPLFTQAESMLDSAEQARNEEEEDEEEEEEEEPSRPAYSGYSYTPPPPPQAPLRRPSDVSARGMR